MNMVIQSFDNLHDNRVLRYCADFEAHSLHMDTQTGAGEKVSLHFTDLLGGTISSVFPLCCRSRNCGSGQRSVPQTGAEKSLVFTDCKGKTSLETMLNRWYTALEQEGTAGREQQDKERQHDRRKQNLHHPSQDL